MPEIIFILEPDTGRVTVESSQASAKIAKEISRDLGQGINLNCARPNSGAGKSLDETYFRQVEAVTSAESIYLYHIYHHSTVDGPGRRSVIQMAGCSIRCPGCYIPETHSRANGKLVSIAEIVSEIEKRSGEHDGVTILGGEPFDQTENLKILVEELKFRGFHLVIYSGFTLESLLMRNSEDVMIILDLTDLLIDGSYEKELTRKAGEYRGSSNQRMILHPLRGRKNNEAV